MIKSRLAPTLLATLLVTSSLHTNGFSSTLLEIKEVPCEEQFNFSIQVTPKVKPIKRSLFSRVFRRGSIERMSADRALETLPVIAPPPKSGKDTINSPSSTAHTIAVLAAIAAAGVGSYAYISQNFTADQIESLAISSGGAMVGWKLLDLMSSLVSPQMTFLQGKVIRMSTWINQIVFRSAAIKYSDHATNLPDAENLKAASWTYRQNETRFDMAVFESWMSKFESAAAYIVDGKTSLAAELIVAQTRDIIRLYVHLVGHAIEDDTLENRELSDFFESRGKVHFSIPIRGSNLSSSMSYKEIAETVRMAVKDFLKDPNANSVLKRKNDLIVKFVDRFLLSLLEQTVTNEDAALSR